MDKPPERPDPELLRRLSSRLNVGILRRKRQFVADVFKRHAGSETGAMTRSSLVPALRDLGMHMQPGEEEELFFTHDITGDGLINFEMFWLITTTACQVEQWASTLPLARLLTDCMPIERGDEDPIRAISTLTEAEICTVARCHSEGLTQLLAEEMQKLKRAYQEMDRNARAASESQSASKFEHIKMTCGDLADFRGGLRDRAGDPSLDFENAMEAEHCFRNTSHKPFTTGNYKIETTSYNEWRITVHNETDRADKRNKRILVDLEQLYDLDIRRSSGLSRIELIAIVLYTGPMYGRYNCILRRYPPDECNKMLDNGETYATTIHSLVSAVLKLASVIKIPDGLKLYRGLGRITCLPDQFFKAHSNGGRGFTECGFMSTTSKMEVAADYAIKDKSDGQLTLPIVLEISVSAIDRGASVKVWCMFVCVYVCI
jgi:hypothetical protein